MLHFVTSYMKQNKSRKQTLESAQNGLEIILKVSTAKKKTRRQKDTLPNSTCKVEVFSGQAIIYHTTLKNL